MALPVAAVFHPARVKLHVALDSARAALFENLFADASRCGLFCLHVPTLRESPSIGKNYFSLSALVSWNTEEF